MSPSIFTNGGASAENSTTGRFTVVYSEVQTSRLNYSLPLPSVLKSSFKIVDGPLSFAVDNPGEIAELFSNPFRQLSAMLVPSESALLADQKLKIGVALSGGQAPG
ncbi:hypothetical protein PVL29_006338 [Vitis rotundifolia]|uniref:Uncharacterized protein n=1 Tax=Vitis rotundifolia TaxID=103349 RepID=A0AA39DXX9_VITRO|nr:hypothetical protein PVL29_006338 [Vitis rotundifolia]